MSEHEFSASFESGTMSDEVWALLRGDQPSTYSVTLDIPARRRTFREWLTRKPHHRAQRVHMPQTRITDREDQK